MLLLHGIANNGKVWDVFCDLAPSRAELWCAELPWRGDGSSDWSYQPDPTRWVAQALERMRAAAGRVDLVIAHSYSAILLLDLLSRAPGDDGRDLIDRFGVGALAFVAPFYRARPEDFDWKTMAGMIDKFLLTMQEGIRVAAGGRGNSALHGTMAERVCERIGPYGWTRLFDQYLRTPWVDTSRIRVPTLIVAGSADLIADPAEGEALAGALPAATFRPIDGSGHFPMIERAEQFADALGEFINQLSTKHVGDCTMTDTAVKILLTESTTVTYTPGYEGANIGTVIGFKHVNYLVEKAVIDHFRRSGLAVGALYERHGLGFDVTHIESRINTALIVDDEASIEVKSATKDGANELAFKVVITVERDGERKKVVTSTVRAVLRYDENDVRMLRRLPVPECLDQFVVARIGDAEPGAAVEKLGDDLVSGGSTDHDPVLEQLTAGTNSYAWKFRIPYTYVHFFDRLQISGYLRLMEEAKHRFVDARGIGIRKLLQEQNWIPVVTHSTVTLLDEALLEEDLYIVYTVDSIFKNLLYTSKMDYYVVRNGHLVRTATGVITHAYGVLENGKEGRLVEWDERVAKAFLGASTGS